MLVNGQGWHLLPSLIPGEYLLYLKLKPHSEYREKYVYGLFFTPRHSRVDWSICILPLRNCFYLARSFVSHHPIPLYRVRETCQKPAGFNSVNHSHSGSQRSDFTFNNFIADSAMYSYAIYDQTKHFGMLPFIHSTPEQRQISITRILL